MINGLGSVIYNPCTFSGRGAVPPLWCGKNTTSKLYTQEVVYVVNRKNRASSYTFWSLFCPIHCCITNRPLPPPLNFPALVCTAERPSGCVFCPLRQARESSSAAPTSTILKFQPPAATSPKSATPPA